MKNKDIISLNNNLKRINLKGVKFSYGIAKNISLLDSEIKTIEKTSEPTQAFNEYEKERIELAKKYAKKNEDGTSVIENNRYILEDKEGADKEFEKLKKTHKVAIEGRDKQLEEFNKLLEEESNVELYKIKLSDVPEDISTEQMTILFPIIEE